MPADIWADSNAVREYIGATIQWYNLDGIQLKQKPCDRAGRRQKGSLNVSWTTPTLMKNTCSNVCDCNYPWVDHAVTSAPTSSRVMDRPAPICQALRPCILYRLGWTG